MRPLSRGLWLTAIATFLLSTDAMFAQQLNIPTPGLRVKLEVYQVSTSIGDCDPFFTNGASDPAWRWTGTDITNKCYSTTCNGCSPTVSLFLFDETFVCSGDIPGSIDVTFKGCEDDGAGCSGGTFVGICDGTSAIRTDNLNVPTSTGTYDLGTFSANSTGCVGSWSYKARWVVTGGTVSPPSNDKLCFAATLPLGSKIQGTNLCATQESNEITSSNSSITCYNSVWYTFVPPGREVKVSTDFSGTDFDTEIAVYRQDQSPLCNFFLGRFFPNWSNLTEVGSNDDILQLFNLKSELELNCLDTGSTYYIQVGGNDLSERGDFEILVENLDTVTSIIPTDICSAYDFGILDVNNTVQNNNFSNHCSVTSPSTPTNPTFNVDAPVWITFQTDTIAPTELTIEALNDPLGIGDPIDLQLALYQSANNTCTGSLQHIESSYSPILLTQELTIECLNPLTTYYLLVDGAFGQFTSLAEGYFGIKLETDHHGFDIPDDICSAYDFNVISTGDTGLVDQMVNFCATREAGEPVSSCNTDATSPSIWFRYRTDSVPPTRYLINALSDPQNVGDDLDIVLSIFTSTNDSCTGSLSNVKCSYNPDLPQFWTGENLELNCPSPETTYFVRVEGSQINRTGYLSLEIIGDDRGGIIIPDDLCNAFDLGTLVPGTTLAQQNLSNFCATTDANDPIPIDTNIIQIAGPAFSLENSVWMKFRTGQQVAPYYNVHASHTIDLMDIQLALFEASGSCSDSLIQIAQKDDPLSFNVFLGNIRCLKPETDYYILVDGLSDPILSHLAEGIFDISVTAAPQNGIVEAPDDICQAYDLGFIGLNDSTYLSNFSNRCATVDNDPISPCNAPILFDLEATTWFKFKTYGNGCRDYRITTFNDPMDLGDSVQLQWALYTPIIGTNCSGFMGNVICQSSNPLDQSTVGQTSCLSDSTTYYLQVSGIRGSNPRGYFGVSVQAIEDSCSEQTIDSVLAINHNQGVYQAHFTPLSSVGTYRIQWKTQEQQSWRSKPIFGPHTGSQRFNITPSFDSDVQVRIVELINGNWEISCDTTFYVPCKDMLIQTAEVRAAVCEGDSSLVRVGYAGGMGAKSILWSNGTTTKFTYAQQGEKLYATVTDAAGCSITDSITATQLFTGSAPRNMKTTRSGTLVTTSWSAPTLLPGQSIIAFRVNYRIRNTVTWSISPLTTDTFMVIDMSNEPAGNYHFAAVTRYSNFGTPATSNRSCFALRGWPGLSSKETSTAASTDEISDQVFIYPNPTSDKLYVQAPEGAQIQLTNMQGKILMDQRASSEETTFDMSNLAQAVYLIKVTSNDQTIIEHVVKN